MQENQQVVFMSDGGEDVRWVQTYLHPNSEQVIDGFYITMRLTVLQSRRERYQQSDGRPPRRRRIASSTCCGTAMSRRPCSAWATCSWIWI
jgi:hypothetical protein